MTPITPAGDSLDTSEVALAQRLRAVEVELQNLKEQNASQHNQVNGKIDAVTASIKELSDSLLRGPDSHEGRLRVVEALGNKGLVLVSILSVLFTSAVGMMFGWIPNPFRKGP